MTEETQRQRRACERYVDTPPNERSLRRLAEELDIPPRTLERWSAAWNWRHRAMMRDAQVVETHEQIADHDLKQSVHAGLLRQVDEGLRDLAAGRRGQRSGAELAAMLRSALHADDGIDKNANYTSESSTFDWTRLTIEESAWLERTLAKCRGDARPIEEDATIRALRQRRQQIYEIVGDFLRGHSDVDARGALSLLGQCRQIEKKLGKIGRPVHRKTECDLSILSDEELDRLGRLLAKGKGTPMPPMIRIGGLHGWQVELASTNLENFERAAKSSSELWLEDDSGVRLVSIEELRKLVTAA